MSLNQAFKYICIILWHLFGLSSPITNNGWFLLFILVIYKCIFILIFKIVYNFLSCICMENNTSRLSTFFEAGEELRYLKSNEEIYFKPHFLMKGIVLIHLAGKCSAYLKIVISGNLKLKYWESTLNAFFWPKVRSSCWVWQIKIVVNLRERLHERRR